LRLELGLDSLVVKQFRRIDWQNGGEGSTEINHGNARVGKSIIAKVQGIDELPDELQVPTPVYTQAGEREEYLVRCFVEIDPTNQVFGFGPMPDELVKIVDLAQSNIRKRLDKALAASGDRPAVPVYYGRP
jgi:hypothetical protein